MKDLIKIEKLYSVFSQTGGISNDTRTLKKGDFFVCLKGENFDGNQFAQKALELGAAYVVIDNPEYNINDNRIILVENSLITLQKLANFHRKQFNIPVIGITGTNGKTTTKELMQAVLSKKYNVLYTLGNYNNHIGVPLTLLRIDNRHELAIIEMGASKPGDIKELCEIAEPTHGIITNIGKAHLEGMGDMEGVINTKKELYDFISQNKGHLFVNADDKLLNNIIPEHCTKTSYGIQKADITGELIQLSPFIKMTWKIKNYTSPLFETKMIGEYNFYNFLSAISIGVFFNVENELITDAIKNYVPENKRSQVVKTTKNTLIMDCYNANPTSMSSSLRSFSMIQNDNKLCILGAMKELGESSEKEHEKIIRLIEELNLKCYTVGEEYDSINSKRVIEKAKNVDDLIQLLDASPISNHLILLKGSRSVALEKLEKYL